MAADLVRAACVTVKLLAASMWCIVISRMPKSILPGGTNIGGYLVHWRRIRATLNGRNGLVSGRCMNEAETEHALKILL